MIVYHEVDPASLQTILREGIKRSSDGEKTDELIGKTDEFLDKLRPAALKNSGVGRRNAIYAYLSVGNAVVDIVDGTPTEKSEFVKNSEQVVLELEVDSARAYVSDLDIYDALKAAIQRSDSREECRELAAKYWDALIPLSNFSVGEIARPEVIITYDIPRAAITVLPSSVS